MTGLLLAVLISGYRLERLSAADSAAGPNHRGRHPSSTAAAPSRRRRRLPSPPRRHAAPATAVGYAVRRVVRPGDLVALPALLTRDWQFPARATPHAWVDLAGVVWLGTDARQVLGTDDGTVPTRLRRVLADLAAGRRQPDPADPQPPDPRQWQVERPAGRSRPAMSPPPRRLRSPAGAPGSGGCVPGHVRVAVKRLRHYDNPPVAHPRRGAGTGRSASATPPRPLATRGCHPRDLGVAGPRRGDARDLITSRCARSINTTGRAVCGAGRRDVPGAAPLRVAAAPGDRRRSRGRQTPTAPASRKTTGLPHRPSVTPRARSLTLVVEPAEAIPPRFPPWSTEPTRIPRPPPSSTRPSTSDI